MKNYNHIIKGVKNSDRRSQMAFYDLFYRSVFQSAYSILSSHEEAEEIMHDTFLKVFSNAGLLLEDRNAMNRFLKRITANHAIDVMRKRKDFIFLADDDDWMDVADEVDNEENELTISDIKDGIAHLSPAYRSIISLRLFEDMSFAEIAGQLKLNASTTRVQYSRGILKLRTFLQQKLDEYV